MIIEKELENSLCSDGNRDPHPNPHLCLKFPRMNCAGRRAHSEIYASYDEPALKSVCFVFTFCF